MTLVSQAHTLSALFKSNLGSFMSRLQGQAGKSEAGDIEALLTDLDLIISNQKQLNELLQRGKTKSGV